MQCFSCGQLGHFSSQCPRPMTYTRCLWCRRSATHGASCKASWFDVKMHITKTTADAVGFNQQEFIKQSIQNGAEDLLQCLGLPLAQTNRTNESIERQETSNDEANQNNHSDVSIASNENAGQNDETEEKGEESGVSNASNKSKDSKWSSIYFS